MTLYTPGVIFCLFLALLFILEPEAFLEAYLLAETRLRLLWLNHRLYHAQKRLHRQFVRFCRATGMPEPGPFKFEMLPWW